MNERKRVNIKTILVDPVLRKEIVEGATNFICKVEGIRPHSLSPAAQAVLDACDQAFDQCGTTAQGLAAALKAVADQVVPENTFGPPESVGVGQRKISRIKILAIAAELKNC